MRGRKRWHGCLHEGFCSTNFGEEGLSKSGLKKKLAQGFRFQGMGQLKFWCGWRRISKLLGFCKT
jgi:hypothetical protein